MTTFAKMLIEALRADAGRHEQSSLSEVGCEFDTLESYRAHNPGYESNRDCAIAHIFWDAWIDQVRHGFGQNFYSGIAEPDWPRLARYVADCLEHNRPITDPILLRHFDRH